MARPSPASATTFNPDGIAGYKHTCSGSCSGTLTEWDPDVPSEYFPSGSIMPLTGTDVLVIQRADTLSAHLTGQEGKDKDKDKDNDDAKIQIIDTTALAGQLAAGDVLMVSDCQSAAIFKAPTVSSGSDKTTISHSNSSNTSSKLTHSYDNSAQLMKLVTRVYFIGRRGNDTSNPPSLYRKELGNDGSFIVQELVEGVEVLRFSYGEDTDNDRIANIYRDPSSVSSWRKVLSVRTGLLVGTTGNVEQALDTRIYDLAGNTAGPYNDKKRRRAFNSAIRLRNHY